MSLLFSAPQIPGLSPIHQEVLNRNVAQLHRKAHRNRLRRRYYDHKNALRDLGISIPPSLRTVETVVGWPAKAVDAMSRRNVLDNFTTVESDTESMGLDYLMTANRMETVVPHAHTSSLIHSTAFGFVTAGDVEAGEPEAIMSARSAEWATGTWDSRRRCLSDALSVISVDGQGDVTEFVLYVPNLAIVARKEGRRWDLRQSAHDLGIPVEPLPYGAELDRPFGKSRISRPVMSITDSAVRTALRTEVGAEFFNAPQRYALGAEEGAFGEKTGWEVLIGRLLTLTRDEDGNLPTVGQFAQQSMQPNIEQMRSLASQFAGETSLHVGSMGIVQDNPSSAEALYAAKEDLIIEIQHWQTTSLGPAWQRLATHALRLIDDTPAAQAAYSKLRANWKNPATPSIVSAADAVVKQIAAIPKLAETSVVLEQLGYSSDQIKRIENEWRRNGGGSALAAILANRAPVEVSATAAVEPAAAAASEGPSEMELATTMKAKFDALGVAVRAGVDPADAARRLGLEGIKLTGLMPTSLKEAGGDD